jgi:hypothetical protein
MGEAWYVVVFIVRHRCSRHRSGSWGASQLAAAGSSSQTALAALSFVGEGCGHHIRSLLLFWRILPFVAIVPLSSVLDGGSLQRFMGVVISGRVVVVIMEFRVSFPSFHSHSRRWRSSWPLSKLSINARMANSSVTPSQEFFISSQCVRKVWEVLSSARRHCWRSPIL